MKSFSPSTIDNRLIMKEFKTYRIQKLTNDNTNNVEQFFINMYFRSKKAEIYLI